MKNQVLSNQIFRFFCFIFVLFLSIFTIVSCFSNIVIPKHLNAAEIETAGGYGYKWTVPIYYYPFIRSDSSSCPDCARTEIFEDNRQLGPPHSIHENIREIGQGRYSHKGRMFYFSTSDNTDPKINGRSYSIRLALTPGKTMALLAVIVLILLIYKVIFYLLKKIIKDNVIHKTIKVNSIVFITGISFILSVGSHFNIFWVKTELKKIDIMHYAQKAYYCQFYRYQIPFFLAPPSYDVDPEASVIYFGRNNQIISKKQSRLEEVIQLGRGRYQFSDSYFYFSSPDNEDPQKDGDEYYAYHPIYVSWFPLVTLGVLTFCLLLFRKQLIHFEYNREGRQQIFGKLSYYAFMVGLCLLLINIIGLFMPLRNDRILLDSSVNNGPNDIQLSYKQALDLLERKPEESNREYCLRVNATVCRSVAHYWWEKGVDEYRIRVPVWENFPLFLLGYFSRPYYMYQFIDHRKALERGVGMCGQVAIIVVGFLKEQNIEARIVNLGGHTIVTAEVEKNKWQMFDPDYGVALPMSLDEIEKKPSLVRPYYNESIDFIENQNDKKQLVDRIVSYYGPLNNQIDKRGLVEYVGPFAIFMERAAYFLKWFLPLVLLAPFLFFEKK